MRRLALVLTLGVLTACAAIAGLEQPEESGRESGAESGAPSDAGPNAPADTNTGPPIATFELLCNGKSLERHTCPKKRWEFDRCPTIGDPPGRSFVLRNTGSHPIAFIARRSWSGGGYTPGVPTDGSAGELTGVLAPGARAELGGSYNGGTVAIFGSIRPFAEEARTAPLDDEGRVAWKQGDFGGIPTTEIDVAQMTVTESSECWNILAPTDRRHFD